MIKEALQQEAEEYLKKKNYTSGYIGYFPSAYCKQAYIDSAEPRENRIRELETQIKKMSELINRYYMVCTEIPKELRTMTFDSCLEDTVKMVQDKGVIYDR